MVKVHTCVPVDGKSLLMDAKDKFVTHADYKALEEKADCFERDLFEQNCDLVQAEEKIGDMSVRIQQLTAELAECRADAERWKWIRELFNPTEWWQMWEDCGTPEELDQYADQAIARSRA